MMMKLTKYVSTLFFSVLINASWAQSPSTEIDFLESTGKIYVVVAVIGTIFLGIVFLLLKLELRLARMEKELKDESMIYIHNQNNPL